MTLLILIGAGVVVLVVLVLLALYALVMWALGYNVDGTRRGDVT